MTALTIDDPSLVLLVGPAGSGKSTLARRHFALDEIVSSDALRAVLSGDEADQSVSGRAFAILHREVARRAIERRLTVVDATNLRRSHRRSLVARAREAAVGAAAIVLDLPPDVIRARNASRTRVVDGGIVTDQLGWLRRTIDGGQLGPEGFDPIIVLRDPEAVDRLAIVRVPLKRNG